MDLAAGTGLVSKLLIEYFNISPLSLYLVESAERMYSLLTNDLPRDYFNFILCNASMHLMSEDNMYPVISKLLKPKTGYFIYTIWYHSFDETEH
ncbi:unnamed protein product [Rotaria sp. Silwood1]|nr:unnamed protein product [Rotaria sp. Silwood1]CAF1663437.1 unnamed protein product [Rotaria sp. Silwood1]